MRLVPVLFPNREKIRVFNDERYDFANVSINLREGEKWERKEEKERRNSFEEWKTVCPDTKEANMRNRGEERPVCGE